MTKKLTLSVEKEVIERAKKYAKSKERSLSDIIEVYLKAITSDEKSEDEIAPITKSLRGSFPKPDYSDYKKELQEILKKKHRK
jgi:macrodomain Ter protein organizer (MatP/YcbG family)